jgi:hypothetical protein
MKKVNMVRTHEKEKRDGKEIAMKLRGREGVP